MQLDTKQGEPAGGSRSATHEFFRKFAHKSSTVLGSFWAFIVALLVVLAWLASGPLFGYSDSWQLVINTGTTIVTFLMVFLIQNTQNRETKTLQLKLDELLRAIKKARTSLVNLEDFSDEELKRLEKEFRRLGGKSQ